MNREVIAVATVQDLKNVEKDLSGYYELVQDLVLEENFISLGNQFEMFSGIFNGKGHVIRGLRIFEETQYAGLFACNAGIIRNLKLEEVSINATAYAGAVAGYNSGLVENCDVSGSINATTFVGGVVGYNDGSLSECRMHGIVEGTAFCGQYTGEKDKNLREDQAYVKRLYLSTTGDDESAGTINRPLRTIDEAKKRVREWIHKDDIGDIEIIFREGTYYLDGPINLAEEDCFHDGRTVTYKSFQKELVKMVGGIPLGGWEEWENGIVRTFVGRKRQFHTLFVNGELRLPARIEMTEKIPDMPEEKDPMEIVMPSTSRIFSLCGTCSNPVEHVIIDGLTLQITDMGLYLTAQGGRRKEGYDEPNNTHAAVYLENARACIIRNNHIEDCGLNAVSLEGTSQRIRIENNRIERVGYAGIHCEGSWIDTKRYINRNHFIFNNHISQMGCFVVHGAGIYLLESGHNHIFRNLVHDSSRYGISIKGARYGCWPSDRGRNLNHEISFEEHWDYLHSRNNLIEGNEVYDTGKKSLDGGGVEAWGPGKNNVIDYNLIYNYYNGKPTLGWKGHGIFFDDACHYFTATNNIVYESKKQGADAGIFMKSIGTVVRNNVFDVTNTHQGAANISPYQEPCRDQIFMNNIVYADPVGGIGEDGASVEHGSTDRRMYTCDSTASADPMFVDAKNETMHCQKIRLHLPWDSIILI